MNRREFVKLIGVGGTLCFTWDTFALPASLNFSSKRIALVIGNAKYKDAELDNPVNDSESIADQLKRYGFDVILLNDASKQSMLDATKDYGLQIKKNDAVGLFYYAGHAVQFDWKNYLIPIDAKVAKITDVPPTCYDLSELFATIKAAGNQTNLIILDSCRDNPFGKKLIVSSKGLSQFDAPERSLLAYATAPGNVASDGNSAHGLYTEILLSEMKVKDAKIEEVLKRVRLKVRIASQGKQVPWETTSLESDFTFNSGEFSSGEKSGQLVRIGDMPPNKLQIAEASSRPSSPVGTKPIDSSSQPTLSVDSKLNASILPPQADSATKAEREREEWILANESNNYKKIEEFLYRYPAGEFSMVAQARLDAILKERGQNEVKPVNSIANPYSKGTVIGLKEFSVGDKFAYEVRDLFNSNLLRTYTNTVTSINSQIIEFDGGKTYFNHLGNKTNSKGDIEGYLQRFPYEFQIGNSWTSVYKNDLGNTAQLVLKVTDRKVINTPLGSFNAFVIEGSGQIYRFTNRLSYEWLIDPDKCSFPIFSKLVSQHSSGFSMAETHTLISYHQRKIL